MTSTRSNRRRGRVGLVTSSCVIFLHVAVSLFALSSSCGFLIVIAAAAEMTGGVLRGQNTGDTTATAGHPDHRILKAKDNEGPGPTAAPVAPPCGSICEDGTSCSTPGQTAEVCGVVGNTCSKSGEVCDDNNPCPGGKKDKCNGIYIYIICLLSLFRL